MFTGRDRDRRPGSKRGIAVERVRRQRLLQPERVHRRAFVGEPYRAGEVASLVRVDHQVHAFGQSLGDRAHSSDIGPIPRDPQFHRLAATSGIGKRLRHGGGGVLVGPESAGTVNRNRPGNAAERGVERQLRMRVRMQVPRGHVDGGDRDIADASADTVEGGGEAAPQRFGRHAALAGDEARQQVVGRRLHHRSAAAEHIAEAEPGLALGILQRDDDDVDRRYARPSGRPRQRVAPELRLGPGIASGLTRHPGSPLA